MAWKKGESGNSNGRPKGSRTKAVEIIYSVFNKYGTEEFEKRMIALVKKDPVSYYEKYIQPILPKNLDLSLDMPFSIHFDRQDEKL